MNEQRPGLGQQQGLGGHASAQPQQQIGLGGRISPQAAQSTIRPIGSAAAPAPKPVSPVAGEEELESIALEEVEETPATPAAAPAPHGAPGAFPQPAPGGSKIHGFSVGTTMYGQENFKRVPNMNKTGAIRVRSFHGRLSDSGLDYLDHTINEWLEKHPEIEVKFVTPTTGMYDGKIKEPALILNIWY